LQTSVILSGLSLIPLRCGDSNTQITVIHSQKLLFPEEKQKAHLKNEVSYLLS